MHEDENKKIIYNSYSIARYPVCDKEDIELYDADVESQYCITYEE